MFRTNIITVFVWLSFHLPAQRIANYVSNGSFEDTINIQNFIIYPRSWGALDTTKFFGVLLRGPNQVPKNSFGFQEPKTGRNIFGVGLYTTNLQNNRGYPRNRLKQSLKNGQKYCVTFNVALTNQSTHGIDAIGAFFGDSYLDTIQNCTDPITYLTPQVANPTQNIIIDTLNWTAITGTFTANGTEKYLVIGDFKSNANTNLILTNTLNLPANFADYYLDDVSCIEMDVAAYAGPDKNFFTGDSIYIGRELDFAIDPYCYWYKLPNMTTAIDTASGLWVKPTSTATYVVRQELECTTVKWDTVVVYQDAVGNVELGMLNDELRLSPNPATEVVMLSLGNAKLSDYFARIEILDVQALLLKVQEISDAEISTTLSIVDLANGIYLLRLKDKENENVIIKKLAVQR